MMAVQIGIGQLGLILTTDFIVDVMFGKSLSAAYLATNRVARKPTGIRAETRDATTCRYQR